MERRLILTGVGLLLIASVALAVVAAPGPYPVIFVHGHEADADPTTALKTWNSADYESAMSKIINDGYGGYQAGDPSDCKVNTTLNPTTGTPLERLCRIYNFSYYNIDPEEHGVIGDANGQFYPVSTHALSGEDDNLREYYQHSADNACWAQHLADFIDKVLVATGASKVNIVCHSMGGLVARDAITFYGCANKVHKVLLIGTPNHGFQEGPIAELLGNSGLFYQKLGENFEMGVTPPVFLPPVNPCSFYNTDPNWSGWWSEWVDWLLLYDPGGQTQPIYGTIAGTYPRAYTWIFPENDGVVESKSVSLTSAVFNYKFHEHHSKRTSDNENDCLPTSDTTTEVIEHWVLDYHIRPSIWSVVWLRITGAQSTMSVLGTAAPVSWNAKVYFSFYQTPGWSFSWYKGYRFTANPMPPYYIPFYNCATWYDYNKQYFLDDSVYSSGNQGIWFVQSRITYPDSYDTVLVSDYFSATAPSTPSPGCPELYSFLKYDSTLNTYQFVENNTILPHSECFPTIENDYLVLTSPPPAYYGHYLLKAIENDNKTTLLDQVKLYVVDHNPNTQVVTSTDSNIYVYSDVLLPNECVTWTSEMYQDSLGRPVEYFYTVDHLDYIQNPDGYVWAGKNNDSILVSFPPIPSGWNNVGIIVTTGPGRGFLPDTETSLMSMGPGGGSQLDPTKYQWLAICSNNGYGGWTSIGRAFARKKTSNWLIPLSTSPFMDVDTQALTFKIVCTTDSFACIDRVALVKLETTGWSVTEAPLNAALGWELHWGQWQQTNISQSVTLADGIYAPTLISNTQYAFSFTSIPEDTTKIRDFVVKTRGVYGVTTGSPRSDLDEHGLSPLEYKLDLSQPVLTTGTAKIDYQLRESGKTTIEVLDVSGRRVAVLLDKPLPSGYYTLNWNTADNTGRQVSKGVYFIRMVSGDFTASKKLIVIR